MGTNIFHRTLGSHMQSGRKLLIILFGSAAALLVISTVATYMMGRVALQSVSEMTHYLNVLNEVPAYAAVMVEAESSQRGYLLTGDDTYLRPFRQAVTNWQNHVALLERFADQGDIPRDRLLRITEASREKIEELDETINLRRERGLEAALTVVRTDRGRVLMARIHEELEGLRVNAQFRYDESVRRSSQATFLRTTTFIGAGLVNLGFLAWAYRRIARQEWLRVGQMGLNERITGEQNLKQLGDNALGFLARYLDAQCGVLFVENGGRYKRAASYALPAESEVSDEAASGVGVIGEAVKSRQPVVIEDVPDSYYAVASGTGAAKPRNLIVAPMVVDAAAEAVIELGFFGPIDTSATELLARVSEGLGMAVRSAKYRTRLQELLEETQRQAEELQTQSEELRVNNEELEEQSRALKESQARLEQQQVEMEQTNSQLEEQAQILEFQKNDLARAKASLENQARELQQASSYKSEFLANMSHELRTPLNSSLILAKLLSDNRENNLTAEQIKYAKTIESAGNDLLALINDVLDLAKVEAGRMEVQPQNLHLAGLLETLRGTFDPIAGQKNLSLRITSAPDVPESIETDPQRLEQVLRNLLSNALKFTDKGGVTLHVSRLPQHRVSFAVSDTGIGIAEPQQGVIFEPFRQADGSTNRKYGGTGLGLSISREFARLLGGEIQLTSSEGKGSTFTLIVPEVYSESVVADVGQEVRSQSVIPAHPAAPSREAAKANMARVPDDREKLTGSGRVILIVEDDASFSGIMADLAHEMNFQCIIANSATEAVALAVQFLPSAVVLDVGLPDNSGLTVLDRLKVDSRTRHIPVHVVSANDYSQTALMLGAAGYMLKPVKREQLLEAFQKLETRLTQKMRRVLVVEDDAVQRQSISRLLATGDVRTVEVSNVAEALEQLKSNTFDCMVLDLTLPDASGFSLLEKLSREDAYSFPPVIVYTGADLTAEQEQQLRKYSKSIIIKGAKSPERLLDEVTLFLHQVVSELPPEQQRMIEQARGRESVLEGRRVLVVEDDVRNIFALTSLLEPYGVKVEIARNGREGLDALERSLKPDGDKIDLVLMDLMMPEMDGLTATREIRRRREWKDLPVIALTAKAMKGDQEQSLAAGANDYMSKPLDVEKLLSLIRVWMPR